MVAADPEVLPDVRHVACIGLMGSGKTTVGRLLAERLGWDFVDVDDVIESATGLTVADLWEQGGEAAYRPLEHEIVVDELRAFPRSVLATPGGAVLDHDAVQALEANDVVTVYLRATPDVLAQRIARDAGHVRPLVGDRPCEVMRQMFEARDETYVALAGHIVEVGQLTPDQAATAVLHVLVGSVVRPSVAQGGMRAPQDRQDQAPGSEVGDPGQHAVDRARDDDGATGGQPGQGGRGDLGR
jgi:shikimate kinase